MPKYNGGQSSSPVAPFDRSQAHEPDRPKNAILRVPTEVMARYVVRGAKIPVFRNVDLYTQVGQIVMGFQSHPGLRYGSVLSLNSGVAYALFLDDERQQTKEDFEDTAFAMAVGGDPDEADAILQETRDAYFRDEDHSGPVGIK